MRLALLFLLFLAAPVLAEENLVSGVSQDLIQITSNYTGSDIVVFGAVERQEKAAGRDIVVVVRGPDTGLTVRRRDRVAGIFFQNWIDGAPNPGVGPALGGNGAPGMLAEYVALPAQGVVHIAASLSYEEAACLPCAGVTAWNALMAGPRAVAAGQSVLVLGTGGVSLLALQIARAAGARVIATSGSEAKRARVAALGADATVNYRETPEWGAAAAALAMACPCLPEERLAM